jgi:hypothetical protein
MATIEIRPMRLCMTRAVMVVALFACGCAAERPQREMNAPAAPVADSTPRDRDAFLWLRSIDGFNSIDDEHIVLSSGTKHALVKTFGRCDGLRFSETIAVDAPLGYLDRSGVGHLVYRRGLGDIARCPIDRIVAVKDLREAKALVEREKAETGK